MPFNPHQWLFHSFVGTVCRRLITKHIAVEMALLNPVDPVHGVPMTFLIGNNEASVGVDTNPVCRPEPCGYDFRLQSIPAYFYQCSVLGNQRFPGMTRTFGII